MKFRCSISRVSSEARDLFWIWYQHIKPMRTTCRFRTAGKNLICGDFVEALSCKSQGKFFRPFSDPYRYWHDILGSPMLSHKTWWTQPPRYSAISAAMYGFGVAFHFQDLSSETTADLPQCQGCGRSRRLRADLLQDWPATASTGAADFNIFLAKWLKSK